MLLGIACLLSGSLSSSAFAETGTLKLRFVYDGDPAKQPNIAPTRDVDFCGKHNIPDETLIVNPENKGIQNVVVYVYTRRGGSDVPEVEPKNNTHTLANDQCRFQPHIVIAQTGDKIKITNPDDVGHNANLGFFKNEQQNLMIPAKQEKVVELLEAEPAMMPVECNIHPWMRAYVVVLEHPYVGISDADGNVVIEGLPSGEELVFAVRHEKGKIEDVKIGGKGESWSLQRFKTMIRAGDNDLGDVFVPAASFTE